MSSITKTQPDRVGKPHSVPTQNSPIIYGLGSFGLSSLSKVFAGFYMFYYVDVLGLAVTLAAIINVGYAIWDAVNDPVAGYLSDNTRTRWGRRRPWLLIGLPFYIIFLVMVYAVPENFQQGNELFWYAIGIFFLFEAAYTIMLVNYEALFPELFQGFRERTHAGPYYQGFRTVGELVGFALPPIIYARFGFVPMAIFFAGITGISLFLAITRNSEDPKALKAPPLDLKSAFGDVFINYQFWLFTIGMTFLTFTTGVFALATPFWVKYTLAASPQSASLVFVMFFVVAALSVSFWGKLVRNYGTKLTWLWAIGVMALSAIILGTATNLIVGCIAAMVGGAGIGGIKVCREMIMANFVDRSLKQTGYRREGIYYSLLRVMGKFSKILQSFALVLLGILFGYVSGENPGPQPENAFRFLISVFPLFFIFFAWLISRKISFEQSESNSAY